MTDRKSNSDNFREKLLVIGIGAQNAGTTWLYRYLRAHPQVYMSRVKELHYFDVKYRADKCEAFTERFADRLRRLSGKIHYEHGRQCGPVKLVADLRGRIRMDADEREYMRFFRNRVKNEIAFGEITPSYAILPRSAFAQIREQHENVKLIFLMKDPIERFWSRVRKSARKLNKAGQDVCIEDYFFSRIEEKKVSERAAYHVTIENVLSVFPTKDVYFGFCETLFNNESVHRITEFLGVQFKEGNYTRRINATPPQEMTADMRDLARTTFAPVYEYCFDRFGEDVPRQWRNSYIG